MTRAFFIRDSRKGFKAIIVHARDAATALKKYGEVNGQTVILPLRTEQPLRVVTHNSEADYIASQWSGEVGGHRCYLHD